MMQQHPQPVAVDRVTYYKPGVRAAGQGWALRGDPRFYAFQPYKIIVHTTSNPRGPTSWKREAEFLAESGMVSADYLVHEDGVIRFLEPKRHISWAAGVTIPGWENGRVINIECHVSVGEQFPSEMKDLLAHLCLDLGVVYPIGDFRTHIRMHRSVAFPFGRKRDPEGWTNENFASWRLILSRRRQLAWGKH